MMSGALVDSSLFVPGDVTSYPVPHPFVVNIGKLSNKVLVSVEVICELIGIHLDQSKSSRFDE